MKKIFGLLIVLYLIISSTVMADECKEFIELFSALEVAHEYGESEDWVLNNVKIYLWEKESSKGKGSRVGKMYPGSRALLLEKGSEDYKIKSPLDKSIGWISKIQVKKTLFQDTKTFNQCK